MAYLDVYIANFPFDYHEDIFCLERRKEIEFCQSEKTKTEKFYVWKLLELALQNTLHISPKDLIFEKKSNGKWTIKECFFSLSHSANIVSVAISDSPVGIDVQQDQDIQITDTLLKLVLTPKEKQELSPISKQDFLSLWSKKECIYKQSNDERFIPSHYECREYHSFETKILKNGTQGYELTLLCDNISKAKFYYLINGGELCQKKNL